MLVKVVDTAISTDSAGKVAESLPVRGAVNGETSITGQRLDPVPATVSTQGRPVRFVTGKTAQNSAGQWVDSVPVSGLQLLYPVGSRNGILSAQASARTVGSSLHRKNGNYVLKNIRALYQNCYMTTAGVIVPNAFPITVTGALDIGGTKAQWTWGGVPSVVIPGTIFGAWTDPDPRYLAISADSIVHTWGDAGVGGTYLRGISGKNSIDGFEQGAAIADKTMTTGYANTGFFGTYGPSILAGELADGDRSARVVIGVGDSLQFGGAGAFTNVEYEPALGGDAQGNYGWWNRKLGASGLGSINLSRQSIKLQDINAADWSIIMQMIDPFYRSTTEIHYGGGKNDLPSLDGPGLISAMAGNITKFRNYRDVGRHFPMTILPGTSTNDAYATTGGQTAGPNDPKRIIFNDADRAGTIPGQTGCIDAALGGETGLNTGICKATGGAWVGDTTGHPTFLGAAGIAAAVTLPA